MKKRKLKRRYDLLVCSYDTLEQLLEDRRATAVRLQEQNAELRGRVQQQQCVDDSWKEFDRLEEANRERDELREQLDGMATIQQRLLRAENVCRALGGCLHDEELQRNTSVFITNLLGFHEEWARFVEENYGIIVSRIISRHNAPPAHADGAGADLPAPAEPGGVDPR
jgi:dTDP-4-amino-4,6-dideoxygalactose transaminase